MDKSDNECFLAIKSNQNIDNIRKVYGEGGTSIAEIIDKMNLLVDFESIANSVQNFIPPRLFQDNPSIEESLKVNIPRKREASIPKPHIPGKVFFIENIDSSLVKYEQATCLNALKLRQGGFNPETLTVAQQKDLATSFELQCKIQAENIKFLEYARTDWEARKSRGVQLKLNMKIYACTMWERNLARSLNYPKLYTVENTIPFATQHNESQVFVSHHGNLFEAGIVPKFIKPCFESKHVLKVATLPSQEQSVLPDSKLPVSKDPTIPQLLKSNPVDVVISSSGLKQLMDDTDTNKEWCIPIIVKQHETESVTKNVVYIDKPMPKRFPTPSYFKYYCHKLLTKTNLCNYPGIVYSNKVSTPPDANPNKSIICSKRKKSAKKSTNNFMKELKNFTELLEESKNSKKDEFVLSEKHDIFHNVSYRAWDIKPANEKNELLKSNSSSKNIKVLIRCKLDASEKLKDGTVQPLIIVPKMEYQIEHGASIPTKKEIIDQWTALFFRPFSNIYRIRIQGNTSEVVDIQNVTLQKLNNEASTFYEYKPYLRLNVLYEIFIELTKLKVGKYVLRYQSNKGPFIEVLSECNSDNTENKFDLHHTYSTESCYFVVPTDVPWTPLDTTYILPVHNSFKRMPGMFRPLIREFKKANKKKNSKSKDKKKAKKRLEGKLKVFKNIKQ